MIYSVINMLLAFGHWLLAAFLYELFKIIMQKLLIASSQWLEAINNYLCTMEQLLKLAKHAALEAGKAIMEVYAQPFEVYTKDDDSPVTQADLRASNIIKEILKPTGLPFVSEEDLPPDRSQYQRYWLVDPLDGTVEFVNRNGEFTVNIALIDDKQPILGVIYAPVLDRMWNAECGMLNEPFRIHHSAFRIDKKRPFTVLVSRSHRTPEVDAYVCPSGRRQCRCLCLLQQDQGMGHRRRRCHPPSRRRQDTSHQRRATIGIQ